MARGCEVREMRIAEAALTIVRAWFETRSLESGLRSKDSRAVKYPTRVTRWRPTLPPVRFGEREGENRMEESLYGVSVPTPRLFELDVTQPSFLEVA
jgi:hypothetical protein